MSKLGVTLDILNQKGTPAFYSDIFTNRPAAGFAGRVFISTDTGAIYEDTGSTWILIADAGAGTTGTLQQVTTNGKTTDKGINITAGGLNVSGTQPFLGNLPNNLIIDNSGSSNSRFYSYGTNISTLGGFQFTGIHSDQGASTDFLTLAVNTGAATFNSSVSATSLIKIGGTSAQFLKADGSIDSNTYLTTGSASSTYLPLTGGTLTGNLAIPSNQLAIGTATPGAPLDIHTATGTAAQFNGTGVNNAFIFFQNAGANKWRIGNYYNGATNQFTIYNNAASVYQLTMDSGATTLIGNFTATTLIKSGGTSAQFLKADGSVDSNTYLTTSSASSTYLPLAGGTLTGALSGTSITGTSLVKSGGTSAQILAADGSVITAGTNITISGGTISSSGGGSGVTSLSAIGSTANANGATITGSVLNLQPASASFGGVITTGTQTFAGSKTLTDTLNVSNNQNAATRIVVSNTTSGLASVAEINLTSSSGAGSFNLGKYSATTTTYKNFVATNAYLYNGTAGDISFLNDYASGGLNIAVGASSTAQFSIKSNGNVLINTTSDNGQGLLQITGGITANDISLTGATYAATATITKNYYSLFTGSTGQTLTLPSPSSNNYQYVIINTTANSVTISAATSTNIVNLAGTSVASITLIANGRVFIIADGNNKYYQVY
jgi:hypothetical protein